MFETLVIHQIDFELAWQDKNIKMLVWSDIIDIFDYYFMGQDF